MKYIDSTHTIFKIYTTHNYHVRINLYYFVHLGDKFISPTPCICYQALVSQLNYEDRFSIAVIIFSTHIIKILCSYNALLHFTKNTKYFKECLGQYVL